MAINSQKLLPPSKGISSAFSGLSIQKKTAEVNRISQLSTKYNNQNIDFVRKSLIDVNVLLRSVVTEDKNTTELKRRRKEQERFEENESRLELPKEQKKFRLPQVSLPGMSFLDRVKRFLFFTGIGWLFTNFQDQLPKLFGIIKIITPIYGVVENIFKFILSSVVNFIDRGYETYDKIRALAKSIGGEKAQQDFDLLSSKLNEYINYVLIGGMALTGAIGAFTANVSKFKPPTPKPSPAATAARPRVTTGTGGAPVRPGAARVTTSGGKLAQRQIAKNFIRTSVKPALSRLPIVGGLIEFGLSWALGDPIGKAAFSGIGSLLVGAVGTAIGGPIGAAIGGIVGGEVGGRLYDTFFGGKKPAAYQNGGRVIKAYAKGGSVLGDYGSGRTLEVERSRKPTPPQQSTQPGRDVGGQKEIKKLFPNPNENILTYGKPNPFYALENTASDFKSAPYGLGSLMGGAIDVALGQKLSDTAILNATVGLENMFYDNYDKDKNFIDVRSIIFGVIKSAANSALNNIQNELSKGKRQKEEKEKPTDQTQSSQRDVSGPGGAMGVDVGGVVVGYVGSTGRSSGPHIHIETGDGYSGKGGNVSRSILDSIIVDGKPLSSYTQGDGIGAGRGHQGFDYAIRGGAPIVLKSGLKFVEYDEGYNAGYGNSLIISDSSGRKYLLGHLSGGPSDPGKIKELQEKQKSAAATKLDDTSASKMDKSSSLEDPYIGDIGIGKWTPLMKLIGSKESGGNYEAMSPGTTLPGATKMTIADVAAKATGAVGKYQQLPQYLVSRAKAAGLDPNKSLYNAANQELIAAKVNIGMNRGGNAWLAGKMKTEDFMQGLSQEFAVLPNASGRFAYSGQGSSITPQQVKSALEQIKKAKKGGDISKISSNNNYVPKQPSKYNTKAIETYPGYAKGGSGGTRVAIQRIIIKEKVYVPMNGKSKTDFMIAGGGSVNNNMSSHRG